MIGRTDIDTTTSIPDPTLSLTTNGQNVTRPARVALDRWDFRCDVLTQEKGTIFFPGIPPRKLPLAFSDSLTDRSPDPPCPDEPVPDRPFPYPGSPINRSLGQSPQPTGPEARLPRVELPDPDPLYLSPHEQFPAQPWIPSSPC
jgi:hypothetical protein